MQKHIFRQGDVLLQRVRQAPAQMRTLPSLDGRIILAFGEQTGHTHAITASCATLYEDDSGQRYLKVTTETDLCHEEHGAIALMTGTYRVIQQREYLPGAIRTVVD